MSEQKPSLTACVVFVLSMMALAAALIAADDPFVGTWKLNVSKSQVTSGPPPKSETLKLEALDNGLKHSFDTIDSEGKASHSEWSPRFDGKDYPITGDPTTDAGSLKRIDANNMEAVFKKGGQERSRFLAAVSKDGKTLTASGKGTDEKGKPFNNTVVYEKQ